VLKIGALNFIKQTVMDIKGQTGPHAILVGYFNTPLSSIGHPDKISAKKHHSYATSQIKWT
jgi:hypothetical protein